MILFSRNRKAHTPLIVLLSASLMSCSIDERQSGTAGDEVVALGVVRDIESGVLRETRTLNIYLPPGYEEDESTRFPVIYLLDGAVNEDYHHVTGLVQFLVAYELMPPSIVAGIANVDRYRDFTHPSSMAEDRERLPSSGGSEPFREFLSKELKPFIESNFRTAGPTTLIGQSLGDEGEEMQAGVDLFVRSMDDNAPQSLEWHYAPFPEESHATILNRSLYRGFELLYGDEWQGM